MLADVNFAGAKVVQIVPAAKLRMDFQQAETDRILATVRALTPMARKTLKLLESIEGAHLSQRQINTRLGRSETAGDMKEIVKTLTDLGLVHINPKTGVGARVREKIAEDLATYSPEESAIDDCHQAVLYALATES